jgi:hypothetical protein
VHKAKQTGLLTLNHLTVNSFVNNLLALTSFPFFEIFEMEANSSENAENREVEKTPEAALPTASQGSEYFTCDEAERKSLQFIEEHFSHAAASTDEAIMETKVDKVAF